MSSTPSSPTASKQHAYLRLQGIGCATASVTTTFFSKASPLTSADATQNNAQATAYTNKDLVKDNEIISRGAISKSKIPHFLSTKEYGPVL